MIINWQKIIVANHQTVGEPGPLPAAIQGLDEATLADLNWTPMELGLRGYGFVPVIDMAQLRAEALAKVAAKRWQAQQKVQWGGKTFPADDTALVRILGTIRLAEFKGAQQDTVVAKWKIAPGVRVSITLAQAISYAVAIGDNLQACFDAESDLADEINDPARTAEEIVALGDADW